MRPNIDIPWSIHGEIKQYAEATDSTIEEAYIEALKIGTDQLEMPETPVSEALDSSKDWLPFGPRVFRTNGSESIDINYAVTCHPHLFRRDQSTVTRTRRISMSKSELRDALGGLQSTGYITSDWFTVHQIGGAWTGRGLERLADVISNADNLFADVDFPVYDNATLMYVGELRRDTEYLVIHADISTRTGQINNLSLNFLLDGYPIGGDAYYEMTRRFGVSELFNAKEKDIPGLHVRFDDPIDISASDQLIRNPHSRNASAISGILVDNPLQSNPEIIDSMDWDVNESTVGKSEAKSAIEGLSKYDTLYAELQNHHSKSDDVKYQLNSISASYLSPLFNRNSVWNISLDISWN